MGMINSLYLIRPEMTIGYTIKRYNKSAGLIFFRTIKTKDKYKRIKTKKDTSLGILRSLYNVLLIVPTEKKAKLTTL